MCSYTWYPGAGGIHGTTTKNMLDAKKNQIAAVYARNGGLQPKAASDLGRQWMYKSPTETNRLINERG